jgi:hypothetical protein
MNIIWNYFFKKKSKNQIWIKGMKYSHWHSLYNNCYKKKTQIPIFVICYVML